MFWLGCSAPVCVCVFEGAYRLVCACVFCLNVCLSVFHVSVYLEVRRIPVGRSKAGSFSSKWADVGEKKKEKVDAKNVSNPHPSVLFSSPLCVCVFRLSSSCPSFPPASPFLAALFWPTFTQHTLTSVAVPADCWSFQALFDFSPWPLTPLWVTESQGASTSVLHSDYHTGTDLMSINP